MDGFVTLDMFEDYYRIISAALPDDNYFQILMWSVWELAGGSRVGHGITRHVTGIIDKANIHHAGSHKPGPAHRAQQVPIISRSLEAQRIVDGVADQEEARMGEGSSLNLDRHHNTYGSSRQRANGIVPNLGSYQQFQYKTKRGTDEAVRRTYKSHIHSLVGGGAGQQNDQKYAHGSPISEPPSDREVVSAISRNILSLLQDRGVHGFVALLRAFEAADKSKIGNLPLSEFYGVLRASGFSVTEEECHCLFRQLNLASGNAASDQIDYVRFVDQHLCGLNLNQTRLAVIHQAFAKFDTNSNGLVPLESLYGGYCASRHPDVISGKRSPMQVGREFRENFTVADSHGKVSINAFEMYFKFISACIVEDSDFQVS